MARFSVGRRMDNKGDGIMNNKKREDAIIKLNDLKKEYKEKEMQIEKLVEQNSKLEGQIIQLEESLIIKVKKNSKASDGMDTHFEHTISLDIKGRTISNTQWDSYQILTLEERDIQDIYEDRNFYDLEDLKQYCHPASYKKLCAYFDYMDA